MPNFEINRPYSVRFNHAQTESRHYGSSLSNQLSRTRYYTSTSLTMRRPLTVWTEEHYGNVSTSSGIHTTDYSTKWCMDDS
ncbi:unnamed protein product [Schistosoma mattheei]|uniref:Uncharacterized protein n=1 Tax=Schistosoma mattheei TaxID=31246 RepID=A0A183P366_9TREM|nr:unnamed protein product [Schistosoma mattheei]